jgi:hypothetical protein
MNDVKKQCCVAGIFPIGVNPFVAKGILAG